MVYTLGSLDRSRLAVFRILHRFENLLDVLMTTTFLVTEWLIDPSPKGSASRSGE